MAPVYQLYEYYCSSHAEYAVRLDLIKETFDKIAGIAFLAGRFGDNPYQTTKSMRELIRDDDALTGYGKDQVGLEEEQFLEAVQKTGTKLHFFSELLDMFIVNVWQRHLQLGKPEFVQKVLNHTEKYTEKTRPSGPLRETVVPGTFCDYVKRRFGLPNEELSA